MKKFFFTLSISFGLFIFSQVLNATTYYVSPTGTSVGPGTITSPYSFSVAIAKALVAGDSIIVRDGTYNFTALQTLSKSGNSSKFITIINFPNEVPVLDFRKQAYNSSNQGVKVSGNYIHVKGFVVQGAGDNGMQVTGSFNKIENCTFRWNADSGLQMKTGSGNLILNCDSYENFDYMSGGISDPDFGGNADGFADKQYTNTGTNTYKGCRSWKNSDDGWDHFEKIGNTVYDSCWCYANGPASYDMKQNIRFKTDSTSWFYQFKSTNFVVKNYGNGNGFKIGGNYTVHNATLKNCVSVGNTIKGFDQNNNDGTMTHFNCSGYNNKPDYGFSNKSYGTLIIKNCASLGSLSSNSFNCKSVVQANNSWNTGFACVTGDFESLVQTQLISDRQSNGSLPEITLLHQKSTSGMIDKGIDVGLNFWGAKPDLGAFEYNPNATAVESISANNRTVTFRYSAINRQLLVVGQVLSVEIYHYNGTLVYTQKTTDENPIVSTSRFPSGIYLVRVITLQGVAEFNKLIIS